MSEAMTLPAVLKGATETSTLGSTDRLLAIDANGNPKKITSYNLVSRSTSTSQNVEHGDSDWLRVATVNYNSSGIIKVAVAWGTVTPAMILLAVVVHVNGTPRLQCLSRLSGSNSMFSKVRVVRKNNAIGYIDVYAPTTNTENFMVSLIGCHNVTISIGAATDATVPDGFASTEFNPSNWGG